METKKYWQAADKDGETKIYNVKPELSCEDHYHSNRGICTKNLLFPIPLKPLQIAEITVNENSTWSYEIEREEGWYMAKSVNGNEYIFKYKDGDFFRFNSGKAVAKEDYSHFQISNTRIPDECII